MKRSLVILLTICLLFSATLSACGKKDISTETPQESTETVSPADTYLTMAKTYLDQNDTASAIKILEDGFAATSDLRLKEMLESIKPSEKEIDWSKLQGLWAEKDFSAEKGGMLVDLAIVDEMISIYVAFIQGAPASRYAEIMDVFEVNDFQGKPLTFTFEEDGWGYSGEITIKPKDDTLLCTISNVKNAYEEYTDWGFCAGEFVVSRNDDAYELLDWDSDDEDYPDEPQYDTSKASGILAASGLTEQQFRDICTPLNYSPYVSSYSYTGEEVGRLDPYDVAAGKTYYQEHPEDTKAQDSIAYWEKIVKDYENGGNNYTESYGYGNYSKVHQYKKYKNLETYMLHRVYAPKGEKIIHKNTAELIKQIREYPGNYIGKPYVIMDFSIYSINNYVYIDDNYHDQTVYIVDLRDNVQSPNIVRENSYYWYVIFNGLTSTGVLQFSLISVEKIN